MNTDLNLSTSCPNAVIGLLVAFTVLEDAEFKYLNPTGIAYACLHITATLSENPVKSTKNKLFTE